MFKTNEVLTWKKKQKKQGEFKITFLTFMMLIIRLNITILAVRKIITLSQIQLGNQNQASAILQTLIQRIVKYRFYFVNVQ